MIGKVSESKVKIMIVEDEVVIAADLESSLKGLGYTICGQATTGRKALELVKQHQPDLVIMDIFIQGDMDGIEAAEIIWNKWSIPVVFTTAYADTERLECAKLTHPFGYLLKPFQERDLKITVEMALYTAGIYLERANALAALKQAEIERTLILDHQPDHVVIQDFDGQIIWANQSACGSVNLDRESIIGRYCFELWGQRSSRCPDCPVALSIKTNKRETSVIKTPDGKIWKNRACPLPDADGKVTRIIEITEDITTIYRKQEENTQILETVMDAFCLLNMDGVIIDVNTAATNMFGYTGEELRGKHVADIDALYDKDYISHEINELIHLGQKRFTTKHRCKDGREIDVEISCSYALHDSGRIIWFIRDISERIESEKKLVQSEKAVRKKLQAILEPEGDIGNLDLSDIIDPKAIQTIMDEFYRLTPIAAAAVDLEGDVLVAAGRQDICTKFHRMHPETSRFCVESDTELSKGVEPGSFKLYKCKNNMWDVSTPIMVGGNHIGNIFLGQFFFDDEEPDRELFKRQAAIYNFDEEAYLRALDEVPRWSRETVEAAMKFYSKFAQLLSTVSYSQLKLAKALSEKEGLLNRLLKSEKEYQDLLSRLPIGVYRNTPGRSGRFIMANETFARMFGYDPPELLLESNVSDLYVDPDDRKDFSDQLLARGGVDAVELLFKRKDGSPFWGAVTARAIQNHEGQVEYFDGIIEDITERKKAVESLKKSEERNRALIEALPDILFVINTAGRFQDCQTSTPEALLMPLDEFIGKLAEDVLPPDLAELTMLNIEKTHSSGELQSYHYSLEIGGELHEFESRMVVCGKDQVLVIVRDVTERRRAEIEKEDLQVQLQQAQKMEAIGTLAGGISHDFNNLLQAINGYAQFLLMDKTEGDPEYTYLTAIKHAGYRAADLIRQLLLFSRKADSTKKPIEIQHEVEQARKMLERTIPKMVHIQVTTGDRLWTTIADPVQIEQMLLNLGTNAADAMPDGGTLFIEIENTTLDDDFASRHLGANPGNYVLLTVSDTGHGMNKGTMENIFEPFFTTKEFGKGTGLGLASVYGIVKNHKGYITCYSEVDQGTTFKIYLPAMAQAGFEEANKVEAKPIPHGTETILIVDDEDLIKILARETLVKFGYTVMTASTGEEALALYSTKSNEIDLIVLDLGMPGMGGRKCLQEMLQINPAIKAIISSGYSINEQVRKSMEPGVVGYVGKPYQLDDLLNTIRAVLDEEK